MMIFLDKKKKKKKKKKKTMVSLLECSFALSFRVVLPINKICIKDEFKFEERMNPKPTM